MSNKNLDLRACAISLSFCLLVAAPVSAETKPKNWTPPARPIAAQKLSDAIMAAHPELLSVTFHGTPPGMEKIYTMFAGSYPDRIGNPDDPDDVDVITKGITIVDPRWGRHDAVRKFVVQTPLRDAAGTNVGLLVLAFKQLSAPNARDERVAYAKALDIRDSLQSKIASYAALFAPAS